MRFQKIPKHRKIGLIGLTLVFLTTQVFFSPAWVQSVYAKDLASLPSAAPIDFWQSRALHKSKNLGNLPTLPLKKQGLFPKLAPLIQKISNFGIVQEMHLGNKERPLLFLIQDVHMNSQAQENISFVLQEIQNFYQDHLQKKAPLLGVEAASGPFDFSEYRKVPDPVVLKYIADILLKENQIAAVSHFGLTSKFPLPSIVGVDNPSLYLSNVTAYKKAVPAQSLILEKVKNT